MTTERVDHETKARAGQIYRQTMCEIALRNPKDRVPKETCIMCGIRNKKVLAYVADPDFPCCAACNVDMMDNERNKIWWMNGVYKPNGTTKFWVKNNK